MSFIALFNFWMDPLWCFNHRFAFQNHQEGFNERQQKINLIHFNTFKYDGILIGSSRVTVHDTSQIHSIKIFNLALNGMKQNEFNGFIEYAKQKNQKEFKYIIIGLDLTALQETKQINTANHYIQISSKPFYRYKILLSYDTLPVSLKNFRNSALKKYIKRFKTYNEDYIAITSPKDPNKVKNIVTESLKKTPLQLSYNRNAYLLLLKKLKQNNPSSKFIVFTTPLPSPLLTKMLQDPKNKAIYNLWLQDLVKEFGQLYHFCYMNDVTNNYTLTFVDEGHYTSDIGNLIDEKIFREPMTNEKYNNFGIFLDESNIRDFINSRNEYYAI